jgi:hemolysin activation/secretion protein
LALRSTFSVGLDAFNVTDIGTNRNAKFFAWLGQAQYVRRLFGTLNQLILRTNVQLTDRPLLSLEQFTLGGPDSVRGYRVDQIVSDEGVSSSVELRLPVLYSRTGTPVVQFAPFFDIGSAWDIGESTQEPGTICSAGVGLLVTPNRHVNAQLYWGHGFQRIKTPDNDLQDLGLYFKVNCEAF